MKHFALVMLCAVLSMTAQASVTIQLVAGWFESGYVTWSAVTGATSYNVYISENNSVQWKKLDKELVREYPTYYRADMVGLKAGEYKFKVVPVQGTNELSSEASVSNAFTATAHDRSGFAHVGMSEGIGAYKNDGTLKSKAKVLYVWAGNAKTVSTTVITSSKGTTTVGTGLQSIINLYQKGYDTTPLNIRIIGTIKDTDMDALLSSGEGLQVKGNSSYSEMPITIEGIGDDATIHGFGILVRNCHSTEFRNFAIMNCMDDCLSLDTDNSNVWIHNMDFFYGQSGSAADQKKGDGTVDIKEKSKNCTVSYNHFYDSGKCSLGGMKSESDDCWHTYHHNWFDHSDSRHPRIRTQFFHVYNNYYDGNSKYGVGVTMGGSAFVEANYFRNCKYPMLISMQGTDAEGAGTFSGEAGGVIKAYNNTYVSPKQVLFYDGSQADGKWDAVNVNSRNASVTATCLVGGTGYNAGADAAAISAVPASMVDAPADVPSKVCGLLGAGRMNHGDFKWTFDNATEDANYAVIEDLKNAIVNYQSTLVGFAGGEGGEEQGGDTPGDGGDEGDEDPDTPQGGDSTSTELTICTFNYSSKEPSNSMVEIVSGNFANSKGSVTYKGTTYTDCVKIESSTEIQIKPTFDCTVTLVFDLASKKIKLNGVTQTLDANAQYSFEATANSTYTLTKVDSMNLFLVVFTPKSGASKPTIMSVTKLISNLLANKTTNDDDIDKNGTVDKADVDALVNALLNK